MNKRDAIRGLSALAQDSRLDVFRLLVRAGERGLPAGEIARELGVPHNTLSTHLSLLTGAGLLEAERQGRQIVYRVEVAGTRRLMGFLLEDCCQGRPELCAPHTDDAAQEA
ncbi:MAG: metalloregulator ArsR/SmtB family transcription factor [Kiloniellales bacterium]